MSNDTINTEVAEATGEDIETIRDLGFYLIFRVEEEPFPANGQPHHTRSVANRAKRSRTRGRRCGYSN